MFSGVGAQVAHEAITPQSPQSMVDAVKGQVSERPESRRDRA